MSVLRNQRSAWHSDCMAAKKPLELTGIRKSIIGGQTTSCGPPFFSAIAP